MMPRPRRIGHIGMVARDLGRMVDFYCSTIGLQVVDRMPFPENSPLEEGVWLRLGTDHHVISMFSRREPPRGDAREPHSVPAEGLHHLAFEMCSFEDLRRAARCVREEKIPLQGMRTGGPGCQLRLYFWDPESNIVELYWALDQIGWDGKARPYPPVEAIDLESLDVDGWRESKGSEFAPWLLEAPVGGNA